MSDVVLVDRDRLLFIVFVWNGDCLCDMLYIFCYHLFCAVFHIDWFLCRRMHLLLVNLCTWKIQIIKSICIWGRQLGCVGGCVVHAKLRSLTNQMKMRSIRVQTIMLMVRSMSFKAYVRVPRNLNHDLCFMKT